MAVLQRRKTEAGSLAPSRPRASLVKQLFEARPRAWPIEPRMRPWREYRPAALAAAPWTAAVLTLAAGVMLLASAATPSAPDRFVRLVAVTPPLLIELSHFVSSVLGL